MANRFTKMTHFAPCVKTISGHETPDLFFKKVVQLHGLPNDITSDREPQFVSNFWLRLLQTFGYNFNLSSAYHPEIDGQAKQVNQILK
jgi:recombinational DNA repair protein (RecF pathway)